MFLASSVPTIFAPTVIIRALLCSRAIYAERSSDNSATIIPLILAAVIKLPAP